MIPLDAAWLSLGYLVSPDRRLRYVHRIDVLGQDAERAGITVCWAGSVCRHAGVFDPERHRIVLAPWLYYTVGWVIRDVLAHELAHATVGRSCELARAWQTRIYGDSRLDALWTA